MQPEETFVEIAAGSADAFLAATGPNKTMERGIRVSRLPGTPEFGRQDYGKPDFNKSGPKPYAAKKSYDDRPRDGGFKKGPRSDAAPSGERDSKPWSKPGKPKFEGKPKYEGKPKFDGNGPKPKFSKKKG
jgi:ATP-dependent RNA helicase DeaD